MAVQAEDTTDVRQDQAKGDRDDGRGLEKAERTADVADISKDRPKGGCRIRILSDKASEANATGRSVGGRTGKSKLSFRVDADVAERAARRAAQEETTLSAVLRGLLLDYVSRRSAPVEHVRQLEGLRRELLAVGRNLNQVTRAVNAGIAPAGYRDVAERLTGVIGRVVEQLTSRLSEQTQRRVR